MVKIYEFWRTFLEISSQPSQLHERGLEGATQMALHIVAGSLARQDHDVLQLIPVIHEAIAREGMTGSILARSMDTLFMESTYLSRNYHAQVSKLSKSRSYSLLVRPLYARALPAAQGPAAVRNTAIVLSVIPYCPYAIWQDDAIPLSRLLITVLDKPSSMSQVLPALTAVQAIVAHEPGVLQSHLQSVVNEIIYIYGAAQPKEPPSGASAAPRPDGHLARCRKKVLELLAAMPAVYGKELTALSPGVKRLLATASADPVRELRKWALRAKESWAKLD